MERGPRIEHLLGAGPSFPLLWMRRLRDKVVCPIYGHANDGHANEKGNEERP